MLLSLLTIPIIGVIILTFIKNESKIKMVSLGISLINFIISLIVWIKFDENYHSYQFVEEWTSISYCHFHLGIDGISLPFVILTTLIIPIGILASWTSIKKSIKYFYISFLILESLLIAVFIVLDLLLFYITFESCLIPMFLIIGIWGSRERKVLASSYFFLYTLFGSLFMLWSTLEMFSNMGTIDFKIISLTEFYDESLRGLIWLGFFLAFAIKTPIIPFHLWLSEAHTEAPIGGSIVLAGILLKLATYGFLRVCLGFLPEASIHYAPLVYTLATISIIYSSFTILRQIDLKRIIAYSSIGQDGPEDLKSLLQQTICGKFKTLIKSLLQNTNNVSNLTFTINGFIKLLKLRDFVLVRNFVILNNPQITNAFSSLTLVGISEAIRCY
jgi:NADH-ubiquinone oxidoreductase chain 4